MKQHELFIQELDVKVIYLTESFREHYNIDLLIYSIPFGRLRYVLNITRGFFNKNTLTVTNILGISEHVNESSILEIKTIIEKIKNNKDFTNTLLNDLK